MMNNSSNDSGFSLTMLVKDAFANGGESGSGVICETTYSTYEYFQKCSNGNVEGYQGIDATCSSGVAGRCESGSMVMVYTCSGNDGSSGTIYTVACV